MHKKELEDILNGASRPAVPEGLRQRLEAQLDNGYEQNLRLSDPVLRQGRLAHYRGKWVAAAVLVLGCFLAYAWLPSDSVRGVAWADVASRVEQITYLHFYALEVRDGRGEDVSQGWFSNGMLVWQESSGLTSYDDGREKIAVDSKGNIVKRWPSDIGNPAGIVSGATVFDKLAQALFDYKAEEIARKIPETIGDDFLVYRFGKPDTLDFDVKGISFTVGRASRLPVQMKIYITDDELNYNMYIFDYEGPAMPAEFYRIPDSVKLER